MSLWIVCCNDCVLHSYSRHRISGSESLCSAHNPSTRAPHCCCCCKGRLHFGVRGCTANAESRVYCFCGCCSNRFEYVCWRCRKSSSRYDGCTLPFGSNLFSTSCFRHGALAALHTRHMDITSSTRRLCMNSGFIIHFSSSKTFLIHSAKNASHDHHWNQQHGKLFIWRWQSAFPRQRSERLRWRLQIRIRKCDEEKEEQQRRAGHTSTFNVRRWTFGRHRIKCECSIRRSGRALPCDKLRGWHVTQFLCRVMEILWLLTRSAQALGSSFDDKRPQCVVRIYCKTSRRERIERKTLWCTQTMHFAFFSRREVQIRREAGADVDALYILLQW